MANIFCTKGNGQKQSTITGLLAFILVVLALSAIVGCGKNVSSALVGMWSIEEGQETHGIPVDLELLKDGTGIVDTQGITWKTEGGRFYLISPSQATAWDYKISNSTLTLENNDGQSTVYKKVTNQNQESATKREEAKREEDRQREEAKKEEDWQQANTGILQLEGQLEVFITENRRYPTTEEGLYFLAFLPDNYGMMRTMPTTPLTTPGFTDPNVPIDGTMGFSHLEPGRHNPQLYTQGQIRSGGIHERLLLDPWGEPYRYNNTNNAYGVNQYTWDSKPAIWSTGPDRLHGTPDDIRNWNDEDVQRNMTAIQQRQMQTTPMGGGGTIGLDPNMMNMNQVIDPRTGLPMQPQQQWGNDPNMNMNQVIDSSTGLPIQPQQQRGNNPNMNQVIDSSTGLPMQPQQQRGNNPNMQPGVGGM